MLLTTSWKQDIVLVGYIVVFGIAMIGCGVYSKLRGE